MAQNLGQSPFQSMQPSQTIPRFIQNQLAHPPIGPNEDPGEFRSLFNELAVAVEGGLRTTAEYVMLLQVTSLTFRITALERIRCGLIDQMRPEAIVALLRRMVGVIEPCSVASFEVYDHRKEYFRNQEGKAKIEAKFAQVGYAADAVENEAFQLALPSLASIDRQVNSAQKQLMAFFKEIDRRDFRRADELRKASRAAVLRAQSGTASHSGAK